MKTTIFYFTGTGNSLKIAKDLSERLEESALIPIARIWEMENIQTKSEKVGFVFPLYWSGLPKIVYDFINNLNLNKPNYIFAVITSAGDINEQPLQQLAKLLKAKGKMLSAGFYITMPSNYIIGYDIASQERQKEYFQKATKEVELISETVKNERENIGNDIFEKDVSRSARINKKFHDEVNTSDDSFYADENCTSCGICEKVCPLNNINLIDGTPKWQHKCQQCLACINYCPEESIQFGDETLKTQRYQHPEITIQEIINQKKK
jgi:flavodoxin